ncbi:unnamed protein product [Phytophthora fragariaefolia]|uniref:Unnamed protein product n=1 Tax=Phytophthora fragariaefolia TaxID=1490495 RepID=A0A9W6XT86_9STRA|nr:unnamed protein product [Phytophthora fragariaefolia]
MACTSPNQWALASPTASSSSRQEEPGGDQLLGGTSSGDALFEHVRQLILDLLLDESRRSSSLRLSEAAAHDAPGQSSGGSDPKRPSNNPEAEEDGSTARERLLEDKLARVLVELAAEQDNLRLAANAGNALLEELSSAREDVDALQDEMEAAQLDRDRAVRDAERLREQNAALERELQRYDAPHGSWDSNGQNALSHMQQQQLLQRRPSITSRSGSYSRSDSCERCASREVELTQLEQRADELRRRCLELELARERELQRQRELCEEIAQLQQRNKDQNLETARAQQDLEFITTQLEQQTQEVERVQAVRDTLRRTTRRLEAENEDLQARLAARDELVAKLESSKVRAATQLQVAENRTASAQAETLRVTETLEKLQKQLEKALQNQQQHSGRGSSSEHDNAEVAERREKESSDMEHLLEDATREVAALRLENRILRRQNSSEASSEISQVRGRRRRTTCTGNSAMTAAEVLALDNRGSQRSYTASTSSKSDSGSEVESTTSPRSQLPPLEIETVNTAGIAEKASEAFSGDGKKRRNMALELSWVDKATTPAIKSAASKGASLETQLSASRAEMLGGSLKRELESVEEQGLDNEWQRGVNALPVNMEPSVAKRSALARLSHVNENCAIGGSTESNSPDMRLFAMERSARRSKSGVGEHSRTRELAIDELKKDAVEAPPQSPLYLGLSFIACATAATAAGLLVRR